MKLLNGRNEIKQELARRNLRDFIEYTYPSYDFGWFNEELSEELTQFIEDVVNGKQPRLMIFAPPRHGKSEQVSRRLPAFALGKYPHLKIISASYAASLANRMSRDVKQIMRSAKYTQVFPATKLPSPKDKGYINRQDNWEVVGTGGAYKSAGVRVGITGEGADIGIIDDPVKDAKESNSKVVRDDVEDWYKTTFYTRLSPSSGIIICMTRWNEDDLAGRLLKEAEEGGEKWRVINRPAIAEEDEKHRKKGEALHPARYPIARLLAIKRALGERFFNALYQGRPTGLSGSVFKTEMLQIVDAIPAGVIIRKVRAWDFAATKDGGDYTVGALVGEGNDGRTYILDVVRGQYSAFEAEQILKATAARDGFDVQISIPQDPAQAGKWQAQNLIGKLKGYIAKALSMSGSKVLRASAFAAQVEAGNVVLLRGAWNTPFIEELKPFPHGDFDDQVDAATDGFNELSGNRDYSIFDLF